MDRKKFITLLSAILLFGLTLTLKAQSGSEQKQTGDSIKYTIEKDNIIDVLFKYN